MSVICLESVRIYLVLMLLDIYLVFGLLKMVNWPNQVTISGLFDEQNIRLFRTTICFPFREHICAMPAHECCLLEHTTQLAFMWESCESRPELDRLARPFRMASPPGTREFALIELQIEPTKFRSPLIGIHLFQVIDIDHIIKLYDTFLSNKNEIFASLNQHRFAQRCLAMRAPLQIVHCSCLPAARDDHLDSLQKFEYY